jgi:hypothetical protein
VRDLDPQDAKLITLARGARGRIGAAEGAAVRDDMGRTYSGATVTFGPVALTALELAVAQAVASGAKGLEAAVIITASDEVDVDAVRALTLGIAVHLCNTDGSVRSTLRS